MAEQLQALDRITPTYMGNTLPALPSLSSGEDHPHIHGEYDPQLSVNENAKGSPPHTWGIPNSLIRSSGCRRITPTYMGNTKVVASTSQLQPDHPHIHGEYRTPQGSTFEAWGSPPHTWGIRSCLSWWAGDFWITPTYMGNTVNRSLYDAFFRSLVCHF